jgi:hypothetical protein
MSLHRNLAFSLLALLVFGAGWALLDALRSSTHAVLADYMRVLEGVIAVQVLIGIGLWVRGGHPSFLHVMYGAVVLAPLPLAVRAWRLSRDRRGLWVLFAGCLATLLFLVRAVFTG